MVRGGDVLGEKMMMGRRKVKGGKREEKGVVGMMEWGEGEKKRGMGEVVDVVGERGEKDVEMKRMVGEYGVG